MSRQRTPLGHAESHPQFRDATSHRNYYLMRKVELLPTEELGDEAVMQIFLNGLPEQFRTAEDIRAFGPQRCIPWTGKVIKGRPILKVERGLILNTDFRFGSDISERRMLSPSATRIAYWLFVDNMETRWTTERLCENKDDHCVSPYHLHACFRGKPVRR